MIYEESERFHFRIKYIRCMRSKILSRQVQKFSHKHDYEKNLLEIEMKCFKWFGDDRYL